MPYPLVSWSPQAIIRRIDLLNSNQLYYESVIVSTQVIERLLKRIVRNELATVGMRLISIDDSRRLTIDSASGLNQIDQSLRRYCQSIDTLSQDPWRLTVKTRIALSMAQFITIMADNSAWQTLISTKRLAHEQIHSSVKIACCDLGLAQVGLPYGLNRLRHKLVHAPNAAPLKVVTPHAFFGRELVACLLSSSDVMKRLGLKDPLKACRISRVSRKE